MLDFLLHFTVIDQTSQLRLMIDETMVAVGLGTTQIRTVAPGHRVTMGCGNKLNANYSAARLSPS